MSPLLVDTLIRPVVVVVHVLGCHVGRHHTWGAAHVGERLGAVAEPHVLGDPWPLAVSVWGVGPWGAHGGVCGRLQGRVLDQLADGVRALARFLGR